MRAAGTLSKPVIEFFERSARRALQAGDCIKMFDGSFHYVQYVNSSGAYAVPLSSVNREIKGQIVGFTAGGRTISVTSAVEVVHPLTMGGNSQEYRRYAIMAKRSGKGFDVGTAKGTTFDTFDDQPLAEGYTADQEEPETVSTNEGMNDMAKKAAKAKAKTAGKAKTAKAPKEVRKCACECGTDTTGYFAPGHDARMHGWIAKLTDGRIERKDIPTKVANRLALVQTANGWKATKPHFWKE